MNVQPTAPAQEPDSAADRRALEALVVDNPELERLETLLDQFNIFEAVGWTRQELRHSAFLAFLLDPRGTHGLGDAFLKRFLQKALLSAGDPHPAISPIDFDIWSLDQVLVLSEWQNIDILLLDEQHKLAVIIENKIDSGEHDDQLCKYWRTVGEQHPGWKRVGIYLTPDGQLPSAENYSPLSYEVVCQIIETLATSRSSSLGADVLAVMNHYTRMLRRHIVDDPAIADLCQRLYQKHRRALDLIYEHRPDRQSDISEFIANLIGGSRFTVVRHTKGEVLFFDNQWCELPLDLNRTWTKSGRVLLLQFFNPPDRLKLGLYIGPGPKEVRDLLYDAFKSAGFIKKMNIGVKWDQLVRRPFLTKSIIEQFTIEEIQAEIRKHWEQFIEKDLDGINAVVQTVCTELHAHNGFVASDPPV